MAIFIVENNGKISYGIKRYVCKTMADIPVEVNGEEIAPGSKVYVSDEKKTYMLNTAGQWVEIKEGSGGASALSDLTDVDISGSVQGGKVLKYNAVEDKWAPGDDSGNVQSDWNENDPTSGAYILNKPTIPAAQVQSDWNESDTTDPSYIQNKPSVPNSYIELTQAEYDALTPAEKMSDTPYLITDANGDGSQFQPVIYSTTEREIGVWTNGKPLYEKSFSVTAPERNVPTNIIEITSLSVDDVASLEGVINAVSNAIYTGNTDWRMWTRMNWESTNKDYIACNITNNAYAVQPLLVTLRYTKTTDVPGSGVWTPQGVPAVHYSTDERIVGTWIDGSTLYEKTVHIQPSGDTADYTNVESITDIDVTTEVMFVAKRQDSVAGTTWYYTGNGSTYPESLKYSQYKLGIRVSNGYLQYYVAGYDVQITDIWATIRYTKSST